MTGWMGRAACRDADPEPFFGSRAEQVEAAADWCARCPVRGPCAEQGASEPYGVWGGLPEGAEGRPAGPGVRRVRPLAPCGTQTARARHRKRGESCETCWPPAPDVDPLVTEGRRIVADVAGRWGLPPEALSASYEHHRGARPAGLAAAVEAARRMRAAGLSYPQIGGLLDRDHSTIVHHLAREAG